MGRLNILTVLMCAAVVGLTACGSNDEVTLGSRDDIIIMNNGVPVGQTQVASAEAAETSADAMPTMPAPDVEMADDSAQPMEDAEQMAESAPVVTEAQDVDVAPEQAAVETKAEEVVASVEQTANETPEVVAEKPEMNTAETMEAITPAAATSSPETTSAMAEPEPQPQVSEAMPETASATMTTTEEKVEGGCYKQVLIPAEMDVSGKVVQFPKLEERRVVCANKMDDSLVAVVQNALISKGYKVGAADGKLGDNTYTALEAYQKKNGLGLGGFTYETLESLGIKL
ncbi:MAG: peptidoglycan-binding protein [Alphaproteobacteria bacterium]|nr:peptidoglycan-binding protein [Alphaproteobacteria bacterium]